MCGIAGIVALNEKGLASLSKIHDAIQCLNKRGPDAHGTFFHNRIALGHTRLSIIDTSNAASQPMIDASGRYTIIFNGEFFNFKEHRQFILDKVYRLKSQSDTEVLLYLYIIEGEKCLQRVNGFFALAIYDKEDETLFIARDRIGVKPLLVYQDDNNLMFASEMKSLLAMGIPKEIDKASLFTYLQLNYIPAPHSIFKGVKKLEPGHFMKLRIADCKLQNEKYYSIPLPSSNHTALNYDDQQKELIKKMDASVQLRLISDVPLGAFLSGGIDSSVVVAVASRHTKNLNTFSIGFRDEPMYDETYYADLVAQKCKTNHTVFSLTNDDLFNNLFAALDYIDEPFADSSALNQHVLSMHTSKQVKVALSGDGADELFGGYNKHAAELKALNGGLAASLATEKIATLQKLVLIAPATETSRAVDNFFSLLQLNLSIKKDFEQILIELAGQPISYFSAGRALQQISANTLWLHDTEDTICLFEDVLPVQRMKLPLVRFYITNGLELIKL